MPLNQMTDSLDIIKKIPVTTWGMITLNVPQGFSLEVFQGERHLATITDQHNEQRWDLSVLVLANTILQVNLGYRHITVSGHLRTADGFSRKYGLELRLRVSNSSLFASQYMQRSDPIFLVQKEIERILDMYAQQTLHNTMSNNDIRRMATQDFSSVTHANHGVVIDQVIQTYLNLDPRYAEIQDIRWDTRREEARLQESVYLSELELRLQTPVQNMRDDIEIERANKFIVHNRRQDVLQGEHDRIQEEVQQEHLLRLNTRQNQHTRLQEAQNTFARGINSNIEDDFRRGYRAEEVLDDHPELQLNAPGGTGFRRLPQGRTGQNAPSEPPAIRAKQMRRPADIDSEVVEGVTRTVSIEEVQAAPSITIRARRGNQENSSSEQTAQGTTTTIYNALLGATLEVIPETQRATLTLHSIAFAVQQVDLGGPAQRGNMHSGDFLVEINDQPISTTQTLARILDACEENVPVTIRVMRAGQFVDLEDVKISRRR